MKRLLPFLIALLYFGTARAQYDCSGYSVTLEEYAVHTGMVGMTNLSGYTTYRLYVNVNNPTDFVSSLYGTNLEPLSVSTTTSFWNTPFGSHLGSNINPGFFGFVPELAFDTWVTIGRATSTDPGSAVNTAEDVNNPWIAPLEAGSGLFMTSNVGGAVFALNGDANGIAGDDLRVLVGQFTTNGDITGLINVQIFPNGIGANESRCAFNFSSNEQAVPGCTDADACNYNANATEDDGSCTYPGCTDPTAFNYNADAGCDDGSCIPVIEGCIDPVACNYNANANTQGPCTYPGCTDPNANNYDPNAGCDDGFCTYTIPGCNDENACNYDPEVNFNDGSCVYPGCTDINACNFNPNAGCDDASCDFSCYGCTQADACNYDAGATIDDGSCDYSCYGCTSPDACNFDPNASQDDGSCDFSCYGCTDVTACNYDEEAYIDNGTCIPSGCTDPSALNYDANAGCDNGSCSYATGCTDVEACNYDAGATEDDGSCEYVSCAGCTNPDACNYDATATIDDQSCDFSCYGCTDVTACNYDANATVNDGSCIPSGCTDPNALNYNPNAGCDNGSCAYALGCTEPDACNYDPNALQDDGSCEYVSCAGCTNPDACNYDATATIDNQSCDFSCYGCNDDAACNYDPTATINDGSCEYESCAGCTDPNACNYEPDATINNQTCDYSCLGCTDPSALNYDPSASVDDGSCEYCTADAGTLMADQSVACIEQGGNLSATHLSLPVVPQGYSVIYVLTSGAELVIVDVNNTPDFSVANIGFYTIHTLVYNAATLDLGIVDLGSTTGFDVNGLLIQGGGDICASLDVPGAAFEVILCGDCFINCPDDLTLECGAETGMEYTGMPVIIGDCGEGDVDLVNESVEGDECLTVITRTWNIYFDGTVQTCTQIITVVDSEGPEFINFPANVEVDCVEDVPAPGEVSAEDACTSVVDIDIFTSETGNPTDSCVTTTAFGPGADWAIWLPSLQTLGFADSQNWNWSAGGYFIEYNDGTARLYGTIANSANANQIFEVDFWFENKRDWAAWSGLGRSYKDDLNLATPGALYEDWTYYELVGGFSTMTGMGEFAGSNLYFYHMPSNYYFGFQCGWAANNKNANFGMSGWFTFEGTMNGEHVEGHGDVNVDKSCEPVNLQECPNDTQFTYFWRAEDACGNVTIASQTITVWDDVAPIFTEFPADETIECDEEIPAIGVVVAEDNCEGDVTVLGPTEVIIPGECPQAYTIVRTWAAIDECQNRFDRSQNIYVVDTTDPEFTFVPEEVTYECDEEIAVIMAEASDNCDLEVTVTYEDEMVETEDDCPQSYDIIRTFTAVDDCGNEAMVSVTIHVVDTTAPVFGDYTIYTSIECTEDITVPGPEATDNCGEVTLTYEDQLQSGGCLGVIVRTWTAEDECGNTSETEQYITLLDTTPPVIENPADATIECDEVTAAPEIEIYDNCGYEVEVEFSEVITPGECEDSYTITWTWTATDYCENVATATTVITVQDTTDPIFVEFPEDITIECDQDIPAVVYPIAEDNCDDEVEIVLTVMEEPGSCPQNYTIMRIFRGFDNCGNETMRVQTITVQDTTAPEFPELGSLTYECNTEIPVILPDATDNCGEVTVTYADGPSMEGECPQEYSFVRTYTATDECDNSSTATQTIYVVDTTAPVITGEIEIELPCDNYESIEITATDNCGEVSIDYNDTPVSGGCAGRIIRLYSVSDECGNVSEFEQIITLTDEVAPEFTVFPSDLTVECTEVPTGMPDIQYTDNCTAVELSYDGEVIIDGNCDGNYVIERTWTITDNCDNSTSRTWTITVEDTTAPYWTWVPEGGSFSCDEEIVYGEATAADLCSGATVDYSDVTIPGECPQSYTIVRTWTAVDGCGNAAESLSAEYFVYDEEAPVFGDYSDLSFECDEEIVYQDPTATDNCGTATVVCTNQIIEGNCPQNYTIVRTCVATDECGNASTVVYNIEVLDTTAPVITGEIEIELPCDNYDSIEITATDNCSEVSIDYNDTPVSGGCAGRIIRLYSVSDECGNVSEFEQIITLTDEVAPEFTVFPSDVTVECTEVPTGMPGIQYTDNCTAVELSYDGEVIIEGNCDGNYVIERTWTITDNCDNSTSRTWTITVEDTTAPYWTWVPEGGSFSCDEEIVYGEATAADLCSGATVDYSDVTIPGECPQSYTIVRTWTAVDGCGNAAESVSAEYHVYDEEAPVFGDYSDLSFECDEEVVYQDPTATDNCGTATVVCTNQIIEGNCPQNYTIVRTCVATDECGNASTVVYNIEVLDTTAPVITGEFEIELPCDNYQGIYISATDNCGEVSYDYNDTPVSGGCAGRIIRHYTVSDECGNSSEFEQFITLTDEVAPVADYVPASFTVECDEEYALEDAQFSDNCDDNLEILPASSITPQDCGYIITRTWTAVDHCDNETTVSQTITVVDTTAPTSEFENGAVTIECNTDILIEEPVFTDNCDEELTIVPSVETTPGSCDANYTVVYTWTAYDDCNNSATRTFSVTYVDTTAPYWTSVPQGGEYSCTDVLPNAQATASDYCSDVTVDVSDAITPGDCPAEYVLVRTWTAVDACGNEAEPVSAEYHVYDNQAPTILTDLEDVWVECAGDVPSTPELEVTDNCSTFTIDVDTDVMEEDECGNYYAEVTYTVVDACGNTSYASYTINVYDETAPVFECEVEDLVLDCEADVPTPAICEATDNCGGEVTVEYSEEIIGEMTPEEGATATCVLSTPAGPFCDGNDPWSVHFFGLPQGYDFFTTVEGTFTEFENGTAHIQATVVSTINPNAGLIVDVWFENGLSWEDFIAQPGAQNYKDDCNLAGDDYLDWTYYIMSAGSATLIGTGDLAGTTLNLSHAPASHYYGYQVGHAANNVNGNYGNGGWFTANGTLQLGQESYDIVNKSGDFAFEQDCCPQYQIIRTWTATDCTGNTTVIEQNISFADLGFGAPNLPEMEEAMDHDKGQIDITRIYPNPALETAWIEYGSDKATAAELKIFDMKGNEVATIYKGMLEAGVKYRNEVRVSDLESGIYMIMLTGKDEVKVERLVVTK